MSSDGKSEIAFIEAELAADLYGERSGEKHG
jgi:hypothetical protein